MENILVWFNFVFWVPIGISVVLIIATLIGGLEHEIHIHIGDHDIGGHEIGHIGHGAHDHEIGHDPFLFRALNLLGVGRAPMAVVMQVFFIVFGVAGLMANMIFQSMRMPATAFFPFSVICACVAVFLFTGRVAGVVGKWIPQSESYSTTKHDWIGLTGTAVYPIDSDSGAVQIKDAMGTVHQPLARCRAGEIQTGKEVLLEEYVKDGDYFIVSEYRL